jgi:UV excision repair protein RAD23
MVSMGFPKEECLAAMRAAFNNPERAIDYLLNVFFIKIKGIP